MLTALCFKVTSQELYDIRFPGNEYAQKCSECRKVLSTMPKEVHYGVQLDDNDNILLYFTDKKWFDKVFDNGNDGAAIEIVTKDRYYCGMKPATSGFRGEVQPPVYLKDMKKNMVTTSEGTVLVNMGPVPDKFRDVTDIEFNLIILKNKYLCHLNIYYNLETYRWDLLDMGLYFDTLTYNQDFNRGATEQEKFILQHKIMMFEIPFEHNKSSYSQEDIRPLYDSLNITDFNIEKITIRAYSSVEGSEERNLVLQEERAQSIVKALQSFQKPSIITEIFAAENWVDFLNDIASTAHASLADLSKDQIKEKLKGKLADELEPMLKKHRKALIVLELSKKDKYKETPSQELVTRFNKSISEMNLEQAVELQNSIFEKVRNHESPATLVDKLEVPEKSEFSLLLNKNAIFKYMMNEDDVVTTYKEMVTLHDLLPADGHIAYNLTALKFKVWLLGSQAIDPVQFKKEIQGLSRFKIPQNLIRRMLVNYEIIMCEYYMSKGDFPNKDKSLKYISANYSYIPMSDFDCLSLAQYFASYSKYDWATRLLDKRVKSIKVNEDLLFYYLNLTLVDEGITRKTAYRTILLNAATLNRDRFCKLFNSATNGGISFQMLENDFLRKTWCETCSQSSPTP